MGSKRKLASRIIDHILEENQSTKYIYDVFGGGGAISFEAMQRPQIKQVFYNELNTGVVELLKKIRDDGVTEEFYQWIDRETFKKHKDDNTWFGGLCAVVWSFGNNKDKGYLYGKKIEEDKRLLHEIIVNKCKESLETFNKKYDVDIRLENDTLLENEGVQSRRLKVMKDVKAKSKKRIDIQHLEALNHIEKLKRLQYLESLNHTGNIQKRRIKVQSSLKKSGKEQQIFKHIDKCNMSKNLEYMQHLENLKKSSKKADIFKSIDKSSMSQQLERVQLQQLEISNLSYDEVTISTPIKETIIYLDPPYENTAKYSKGICHKELYEWIDGLTRRGYKVYLSGYESELRCVEEFSHRSTLSATANNKVVEKLFVS